MPNNVESAWTLEVYGELKALHKAVADSKAELIKEMNKNREEFVIFKTKVNTRTALISSIIGAVVLITSLLLNIAAIKDRQFLKNNPIEVIENTE